MKTQKRIVVGPYELVPFVVGKYDNLKPTPFWALPGGGIASGIDLERIASRNGWSIVVKTQQLKQHENA